MFNKVFLRMSLENEHNEIWIKLEGQIHNMFGTESEKITLDDFLYSYKLVLLYVGENEEAMLDLYTKIEKFVTTICAHTFNKLSSIKTDDMANVYSELWHKYCFSIKILHNICNFLNRYFVKRQCIKKIYTRDINDMAMYIWFTVVFLNFKNDLIMHLLFLINEYRRNIEFNLKTNSHETAPYYGCDPNSEFSRYWSQKKKSGFGKDSSGIQTNLDDTQIPQVQSETQIPQVQSNTQIPQVQSETKVPQFQSETKVPQFQSETKVPQVQSETKVPQFQKFSLSQTKISLSDAGMRNEIYNIMQLFTTLYVQKSSTESIYGTEYITDIVGKTTLHFYTQWIKYNNITPLDSDNIIYTIGLFNNLIASEELLEHSCMQSMEDIMSTQCKNGLILNLEFKDIFKLLLQNYDIDKLTVVYNFIKSIHPFDFINTYFADIIHQHVRDELQLINVIPEQLIELLITIHKKYNTLIVTSFQNNIYFSKAVGTAFKEIINNDKFNQKRGSTDVGQEKLIETKIETKIDLQSSSDIKSGSNPFNSGSNPDIKSGSNPFNSGSNPDMKSLQAHSVRVQSVPELLAIYCDKSIKTSDDIMTNLNDIMNIFKFLTDIDIFMSFFTKLTAKRLLYNYTIDTHENDKLVMENLREICGFGYISKLTRMYKDMMLSVDMGTMFKTHIELNSSSDLKLSSSSDSSSDSSSGSDLKFDSSSGSDLKFDSSSGSDLTSKLKSSSDLKFDSSSGSSKLKSSSDLKFDSSSGSDLTSKLKLSSVLKIDFNPIILTTGNWPITFQASQEYDLYIPKELSFYVDNFTTFYMKHHTNTKLSWLFNLSKGYLNTFCFDKRYIFQVSTVQMLILLKFNNMLEIPINSLISQFQNISSNIITDNIELLVKMKILKKEIIISSETSSQVVFIKLNTGYKYKKLHVKIDIPIKSNQISDNTSTLKMIEEDRLMLVQSTIVRIMKTHNQISHNDLIVAVIKVSSAFQPKIPLIKVRIIIKLVN